MTQTNRPGADETITVRQPPADSDRNSTKPRGDRVAPATAARRRTNRRM